MKKYLLSDMVRGWFVGSFAPTVFQTDQVEVGVKRYQAGDKEDRHFHKIATELTVILEGSAQMNGQQYDAGQIVVIEPGESTDFEALTDILTVVVKLPGAVDDKYLGSSTC